MNRLYEADLRRLGGDPEAINRYQVVCLPENLLTVKKREDLLEAGETADVGKLLKEAGLRCALPHELGFETPVKVRKSADLWCGLIWILDNLAAPTFVGVLSSWLTARYVTSKAERDKPPVEPPTIHLAIGIRKFEQLSTLQYEGDAETLVQLLKGLAQPGRNDTDATD